MFGIEARGGAALRRGPAGGRDRGCRGPTSHRRRASRTGCRAEPKYLEHVGEIVSQLRTLALSDRWSAAMALTPPMPRILVRRVA